MERDTLVLQVQQAFAAISEQDVQRILEIQRQVAVEVLDALLPRQERRSLVAEVARLRLQESVRFFYAEVIFTAAPQKVTIGSSASVPSPVRT